MRAAPSVANPSRLILIGGVLLATLAGCGEPDAVGPTVPVEGKVLFDGKPLTKGTVVFLPHDKKGNASKHAPRGMIDEQGWYRLATVGKPGALAGWYRVTVSATKEEPPEAQPKAGKMPVVAQSLIPQKYTTASTSGLEVEVRESGPPGAYDLRLTSRGK